MTLELGHWGEEWAQTWLRYHGYRILETNYRMGKAEIDILAIEKKVLVVIEVKTRTGTYYDYPENTVRLPQQKLLSRAVTEYMRIHELSCAVRFDIIAIEKSNYCRKLMHFKDAFFTSTAS